MKFIKLLKLLKLFTLLKLVNIITLFFIIGCTLSFAAEEQKVVASVNGVNITEAEVQMAIDSLIPRSLFHRTVTSEKREQFRKPAIDSIIERELFYQEAKRLELSIKKSEIKEVFNKSKESFKKKKDFYKALESQGLTEKSYKKLIEKGLLVRDVLKQEVEDKARLSDGDLEKYYSENMNKFVKPEGMRLREISVSVPPTASKEEREEKRKKAEDVLNKLKAGEDFADVAYNYSEDDYRVKGGDLGLTHKDRLLPELGDAASKLNVGEISGLIETIYGYHIVKLEKKEPGKQLDFSEAKDSLKKDLEAKRYKEIKEAFINGLKEKAKIEIY